MERRDLFNKSTVNGGFPTRRGEASSLMDDFLLVD